MEGTKKINTKVYFILTSFIRNPGWCPNKDLIKLTKTIISRLIQVAQDNKLSVTLSHFVECDSCRAFVLRDQKKEIKKLYDGSLATTIAVEAAEGKLIKTLKRSSVDFCLVKNWSLYPKIYDDFPRTRTDIDILIFKKDQKKVIKILSSQDYRKYDHFQLTASDTKRVYYEEYVVRHKLTLVKVDLRFLAVMPDSEQYPLFLPQEVRKLSSELLKYENTADESLPLELFLLSQIMHFFSNDLMRGLRHLYEIIYLANIYKREINWRRFDRLARMYNARLVAMFVFSFAKDVFGFSLDYHKNPTISEFLSIKLARTVLPPTQIVFFPHDVWSDEFIWRENLLLRLFLQPTSLFRKIFELKERDARSVFLEKATSSL